MTTPSTLQRMVARLSRLEQLDGVNASVAQLSDRLQELPSLPAGLHPRLVWVPVGSWGAAMVCDLLGWRAFARAMIGVGVTAALPTLFSGHEDWRVVPVRTRRVATVHAALNNLAVSGYAASWAARGHDHHRAGVALSTVAALPLAAAVALGWGMRGRRAA